MLFVAPYSFNGSTAKPQEPKDHGFRKAVEAIEEIKKNSSSAGNSAPIGSMNYYHWGYSGCPHCGYCPTCGRGGWDRPYYSSPVFCSTHQQ